VIREIKQRCGFEDVRVSPHVFRHTFAKRYLQAGGDAFKLSREMGHSGFQVTQEYLKDFQSTDARLEHSEFSPVRGINLKKKRRKKVTED
jgi:integrase/recombinase XerD